jgi:hypothetical protein
LGKGAARRRATTPRTIAFRLRGLTFSKNIRNAIKGDGSFTIKGDGSFDGVLLTFVCN